MFVSSTFGAGRKTNRPPFDWWRPSPNWWRVFMVEYGSTRYLLFMLGEYVGYHDVRDGRDPVHGGWLPPVALRPYTWVPGVIWFVLKVFFFMFFMFAMAKAIVPANRYDQNN